LARRLLDEAGVAVLAGTDFGPCGEGYLRLCYATSPDVIDRAIEHIRSFLIHSVRIRTFTAAMVYDLRLMVVIMTWLRQIRQGP